jgi:hypothetical protein
MAGLDISGLDEEEAALLQEALASAPRVPATAAVRPASPIVSEPSVAQWAAAGPPKPPYQPTVQPAWMFTKAEASCSAPEVAPVGRSGRAQSASAAGPQQKPGPRPLTLKAFPHAAVQTLPSGNSSTSAGFGRGTPATGQRPASGLLASTKPVTVRATCTVAMRHSELSRDVSRRR